MSKDYIKKIRHNEDGGYDVYLASGPVYRNVSRNVVRCAVGSDLEYLLKTSGEGIGSFHVTASDLSDFSKHKQE